MRRLLALAAVIVATAAAPGPASAVEGEQRVLVLLVTWGPEPYPVAQAQASLAETAAFVRSASFERTWIVGDVTPWLHAFDRQPAQCDIPAIARVADAAAARAGFDPGRYTKVAYAFPYLEACPWGGAYFPPGIELNGIMNRHVLSHELGHTYGITEEGPAWVCDHGRQGAARGADHQDARALPARPSEPGGRDAGISAGRCEQRNYESPYSVMGHGLGDYSAFEKLTFGWLGAVARPRGNASFSIGAIDRPSSGPQALHVVVSGDEYWLEYRPPHPRWDYDEPAASPGLAVYGGPHGLDGLASRFPVRNLLIRDPVGSGRPSVAQGATFRVAGVFEVTLTAAGDERAEASFRWLDGVRPVPPRVVAPGRVVRSRSVPVRWRPVADRGSGIAAYEVRLDGRLHRTVPTVRTLGMLLGTVEPETVLRGVRPGAHVASVVAVDRAGNRSTPATRAFRVRG